MEMISNFCSIYCLISFILGGGLMLVILAIVAISKDTKSKNKVHFYLARDKNGELWLYIGKPFRGDISFRPNKYVLTKNLIHFGLKYEDYDYLKWEDEPVEVFLNLED